MFYLGNLFYFLFVVLLLKVFVVILLLLVYVVVLPFSDFCHMASVPLFLLILIYTLQDSVYLVLIIIQPFALPSLYFLQTYSHSGSSISTCPTNPMPKRIALPDIEQYH